MFTVVSDGCASVIGDTVDALPHDGAEMPTTLGRIKAGWARILSDVKG